MDKAMLLAILAQQAPRLLAALKNGAFDEQIGAPGLGGGVSLALERGYDPSLIEKTLDTNASIHSGSILSPMEITDLEYSDMLQDSDMSSPNFFPSDDLYAGGLNPNIDNPEWTSIQMNKLNPTALDLLWEENKKRPATASALAMLKNNPNIGLPDDPSGIGALYDEGAQDLKNGEYADRHLYPVSEFETPNPATGISEEDWLFDEIDDAADNPYAKNALFKKLMMKRKM